MRMPGAFFGVAPLVQIVVVVALDATRLWGQGFLYEWEDSHGNEEGSEEVRQESSIEEDRE